MRRTGWGIGGVVGGVGGVGSSEPWGWGVRLEGVGEEWLCGGCCVRMVVVVWLEIGDGSG